jgi:hypothetical protein
VRFADVAPIVIEDNDAETVRTHNISFMTPTLTDYVSRVYPIANFTWDGTQQIGAQLALIDLPDVFFDFRAIREKLAKFRYLRASIKITIRLNGTSFHYGKLIAGWSPSTLDTGAIPSLYTLTDNIVSVSGFPHVIVSAGMNEVVGLEIPFVYPYNYLDLSNSDDRTSSQARLFVYVLNPLRLGSVVTPIDVTIFGNLYDVTLCGYSNNSPIVPSVSIRSNTKVPDFGKKRMPKRINGGVAQMMTLNVPQQVDSRKLSPIVLSTGSEVSSAIVDKEMTSYLCPTSLKEIASRPGLLTQFQMSSVRPTGYILDVQPVHPCAGTFLTFENGEQDLPTTLKFVSWPCRFWSGSLKYKLQIVSSNFHSARIQILYTPENVAPTTMSTDLAFELTSHIVDIQCDSEIEFEIPWNSQFPILPLNRNDLNDTNGTLIFRVLNELTYKETPVPDIEFNLWVSAGSDFKLYSMTGPITFDLTVPTTTPPPRVNAGVAQIADTSKSSASGNAEPIVPLALGGYTEIPTAITETDLSQAFATCSPVVFQRQDKKFIEPILRGIKPTGDYVMFYNSWYSAFDSSTNIIPNQPAGFAYYDWYNLLFRFRRGGYIYTALSIEVDGPATARDAPSSMQALVGAISVGKYNHTSTVKDSPLNELLPVTNLPCVLATRGSLQPLCVEVPYSSTSKFAITSCDFTPLETYPHNNTTNTVCISSQRSDMLIYRSCAPDMKFYFQIGPPAIFTAL